MRSSFWAGATWMGAIHYGSQAYLGKEKYLEAVKLLWTNDPMWFWFLLGSVAMIWEIVDSKRVKT